MLCSLMGCGRKDVDYSAVTEGQTQSSSGITEQTDIIEDNIPEHLEYTIQGELGKVVVNADVKLPDAYKKCNVMELSKDPFDDADIQYYVDLIFDEGTDILYMPYTPDEFAEIKSKLEPLSQKALSDREVEAFEYMMSEPLSYPEVEEEEFEEYKFYNVGEEKCEILGEIDGKYYLLTFRKDQMNCVMVLNRLENIPYLHWEDTGEAYYDVRDGGNTCTYSKEEAQKLASDFVKSLGYEDLGVIWTNNARSRGWDEEQMEYEEAVNGYSIYFGRTYDNYSYTYASFKCPDDQNEGNMVMDEWGNVSAIELNEYVRVYVDSEGINKMNFFNPMKEEETMAEEVELLSFDKVESIANEAFLSAADASDITSNVTEIELGYGYIDNGDRKALVPMWYFFEGDYSNARYYIRNVWMKINALDGSLVWD